MRDLLFILLGVGLVTLELVFLKLDGFIGISIVTLGAFFIIYGFRKHFLLLLEFAFEIIIEIFLGGI